MYILINRTLKLNNITFLHFIITFLTCALKVEIVQVTRMFKLILKTKKVNDVCEYSFSYIEQIVLLIIKLEEGLVIFFS